MSDETKHSPEPWQGGESEMDCDIYDANGDSITAMDDVSPADHRRILACVNYCQGIPTEALEAGALADVLRNVDWVLQTCDPLPPDGVDAQIALGKSLRALGRLL